MQDISDRDINQFETFYLEDESIIKLKLVSFDKKGPIVFINDIDNRTNAEIFVNKNINSDKYVISECPDGEKIRINDTNNIRFDTNTEFAVAFWVNHQSDEINDFESNFVEKQILQYVFRPRYHYPTSPMIGEHVL